MVSVEEIWWRGQDSGAIYINSSWLLIIKWRRLEFVTMYIGFSAPWFESMWKIPIKDNRQSKQVKRSTLDELAVTMVASNVKKHTPNSFQSHIIKGDIKCNYHLLKSISAFSSLKKGCLINMNTLRINLLEIQRSTATVSESHTMEVFFVDSKGTPWYS